MAQKESVSINRWIKLGVPLLMSTMILMLIYIMSRFEQDDANIAIALFITIEFYLADFLTRRYLQWRKKSGLPGLFDFFVSVMISSVLMITFFSILKASMIIYYNQHDTISFKHLYVYFSLGFISGLIYTSGYFLYFYLNAFHEEKRVKEEIENKQTMTQLFALKQQTNPHFLFNNLNTLDGLLHENPQKASIFLHELADFYRYILSNSNEPLTALGRELEVVRHFIFLIKSRFEEACNFDISVCESQEKEYSIPSFALITLVENVIKHNKIDLEHPLQCVIHLSEGFLEIENTLCPKPAHVDSFGIGLSNLKAQLDLLGKETMSIEKTKDSFKVRLPLFSTDDVNQKQVSYV